jgi:hypothetical protein
MLEEVIIRKTLRAPAVTGPAGDSQTVARQLDTTLLRSGFKASRQLLEHVTGLEKGLALGVARQVVDAVKVMVGDHVQHNAYFVDFPAKVPDTVKFWAKCLRHSLVSTGTISALSDGTVNLLDLPLYGRYQHTYAELLAAHDELIPSIKDRLTVVHLGGSLEAEAQELYLALAGSPTPLAMADLDALRMLALFCRGAEQPETVPMRESKAVVNAVRLAARTPLEPVDTVTDVLRLACEASGGDVTLETTTRFRVFSRPERRVLMSALEQVVAANPVKLVDVLRHPRRWQRLGERLHPHEYARFPHAQDVFAVARGDKPLRSLAGRVELAFGAGDVLGAVEQLVTAPGALLRGLDRVLRVSSPGQAEQVIDVVSSVLDQVSGRVLCSVREHVQNRTSADSVRMFANRAGRVWVTGDEREPLSASVVERLGALLDDELTRRLPSYRRLVIDPTVLGLAVPLSGKATESGFAVMPRGSITPVDGTSLRFFTYWKQRAEVTDFDLSVAMLGKDFEPLGHVSWTNLTGFGGKHSGDITDAANGASEFIDLSLDRVSAHYLVPQVHVYSGEGFDRVEEAMFGFMTRDADQRGLPYEPRTVRMRSALSGSSRITLPLVFFRDGDGGWWAKWMHLGVRGRSWGNRTEVGVLGTSALVRGIVERRFLLLSHLVKLLCAKAETYTLYEPGMVLTEPVTFVGVERPEDLPEGSEVFALDRLNELIPG